MEDYIRQLRAKPAHHRNYFALAVSGGFTAIIFLVWSYANFGGAPTVVAEKVPDSQVQAVSPFKAVGNGVANVISAFKTHIEGSTATLQKVDLESQYQNMRNDALSNQNGQ